MQSNSNIISDSTLNISIQIFDRSKAILNMKFNIALPLLAALASAENAKVLLEPLEFENVRIEKSYEVEWSADRRVVSHGDGTFFQRRPAKR